MINRLKELLGDEGATPRPWANDHTGIFMVDGGGGVFEVSDLYPRGDNRPSDNMALTLLLVNNAEKILNVLTAAAYHGHPTLCVEGMPCELKDTVAELEKITE